MVPRRLSFLFIERERKGVFRIKVGYLDKMALRWLKKSHRRVVPIEVTINLASPMSPCATSKFKGRFIGVTLSLFIMSDANAQIFLELADIRNRLTLVESVTFPIFKSSLCNDTTDFSGVNLPHESICPAC